MKSDGKCGCKKNFLDITDLRIPEGRGYKKVFLFYDIYDHLKSFLAIINWISGREVYSSHSLPKCNL